ncbi:uncharacterized protein EMH_0023100 [Eimeria mitis]|uniref:Apicomplexan specific protein, related n=1 Tax=Eimeria mitis TaxID=44415 RepID=U6KMN3_9EIME|nr:uncharacterized protein EMH_0023100 [Eimeria mitis]CDJ36713.1 hypothetical protein, conserved [Eimeria mitis]
MYVSLSPAATAGATAEETLLSIQRRLLAAASIKGQTDVVCLLLSLSVSFCLLCVASIEGGPQPEALPVGLCPAVCAAATATAAAAAGEETVESRRNRKDINKTCFCFCLLSVFLFLRLGCLQPERDALSPLGLRRRRPSAAAAEQQEQPEETFSSGCSGSGNSRRAAEAAAAAATARQQQQQQEETMPVYAEGIRHERNCPVGETEEAAAAVAAGALSEDEGDSSDEETIYSQQQQQQQQQGRRSSSRGAQKLCTEKRCCTWFDLANWFGFLPPELPPADFEACFTDVANGGPGLYEKLVVLGAKTLDIVSEMHFYEMYPEASKSLGVPSDLYADPEALRLLWSRRRAERVCALPSLFLFGKSYLAAAQGLPTRLSVAKYVKACVGFCCQSADTENLYKWMPILIEHIFWAQKLRTERLQEDNALLQDLQELFGYKFDHLIPRIRECIEGAAVPQRSDCPTGRELLKLYATDYFTRLSEEAGVEASRRVVWVDQEVHNFLEGPAIPVFAVACTALAPFVLALKDEGPTRAQQFVGMFEALLAACWVISTEEKVKIWMPSLIQRLRQTQLVLHMAQMGDKYFINRTRLQKPAKIPIEPRQIAAANNGFLDPFALWNVDPMRRPLAETPVEYPGPPLYYPGPRGSTLEAVCPPCCLLPPSRPPPRPIPGRPSKKNVTLFDSEENRYELYPLGPQVFPLHRRRQNLHLSNNNTRDGRSVRSCCSGPPSGTAVFSGGPQDKWAHVPQRAVDVSIQTAAQLRPPAAGGQDAFAPTWTRESGRPSGTPGGNPTAGGPLPPGAPQAPCAPTSRAPAPFSGSEEPRVKIRYVTDDSGADNAQKNTVEVYIDDVLVHEQALPSEQDLACTEFKAVLSTPNGLPVVLNFARNGEDGKPTVYITDGRSAARDTAGTLLVESPPLPARGASLKDIHAEAAAAGAPAQSAGCCFTATCGPRRPHPSFGGAAAADRGAPVDIVVSPAYPLQADRRSKYVVETQDVEAPADACIFGNYLKGCMASPAPRTPQPSWEQMQQQVRVPAPQVYTVPRIRAYTARGGGQR